MFCLSVFAFFLWFLPLLFLLLLSAVNHQACLSWTRMSQWFVFLNANWISDSLCQWRPPSRPCLPSYCCFTGLVFTMYILYFNIILYSLVLSEANIQLQSTWLPGLFILTLWLCYMLQVSSTLPKPWLAGGCMICLIFGCSCALSCQLNIRHIPTESGIDFWSWLFHFQNKDIQVNYYLQLCN